MTDLYQAVAAAIRAETGNADAVITDQTTAADVPGWDSVAHARIMLALEETLGITIDMAATFDAENVGELVKLIADGA